MSSNDGPGVDSPRSDSQRSGSVVDASQGLETPESDIPADDAKTVIRASDKAEDLRRVLPASDRTPANVAKVLLGQRLNHFELESLIGGGGMGAVFRAHDQQLDRTVAIKVIPFVGEDPDLNRRFRNEAQSAAKLDHPNIARVFDVGHHEDWYYIVFEFIEGTNIRDRVLRDGPLSIDDALFAACQLADAIGHASERGIVHRDIKPSNVLINLDEQIKLVDMGLARSDNVELSEDMTASGVTLGTFDYISPEQALDPREADVRSDLYSLGCTLYFMVTGEPPYPGGTMLQKLLSHGNSPPPDPRDSREEVSEDLVMVLQKMLAKTPADRYQSVPDLLADLQEVASREGLLRTLAVSGPVQSGRQRRSPSWSRFLPWMAAAAVLLGVTLWMQIESMLSASLYRVEVPVGSVLEQAAAESLGPNGSIDDGTAGAVPFVVDPSSETSGNSNGTEFIGPIEPRSGNRTGTGAASELASATTGEGTLPADSAVVASESVIDVADPNGMDLPMNDGGEGVFIPNTFGDDTIPPSLMSSAESSLPPTRLSADQRNLGTGPPGSIEGSGTETSLVERRGVDSLQEASGNGAAVAAESTSSRGATVLSDGRVMAPFDLQPPKTVRVVKSTQRIVDGADVMGLSIDQVAFVEDLNVAFALATRFGSTRIELAVPVVQCSPTEIRGEQLEVVSLVNRTMIVMQTPESLAMERTEMLRVFLNQMEWRGIDIIWELPVSEIDGGALFVLSENRMFRMQDSTITIRNQAYRDEVYAFDVITDPARRVPRTSRTVLGDEPGQQVGPVRSLEGVPDSTADTFPSTDLDAVANRGAEARPVSVPVEERTLLEEQRFFNAMKEQGGSLPLVAIELTDVIIRGEMSMVHLDYAAELQLKWDNGFLASTGRMIEANGAMEPTDRTTPGMQVELSRLTASLPEGMYRLRLGPSGAYPVTFKRQAERCVFLVRPGVPQLEIMGVDADIPLENLVQVRGDANAYSFPQGTDLQDPFLSAGPWMDQPKVVTLLSLISDPLLWYSELDPRWSVRWSVFPLPSVSPSQLSPADFRQDGSISGGFDEQALPPPPRWVGSVVAP
ncbi:MAG: serine/threonine-protein kinase [Planctomycetota bacterium]